MEKANPHLELGGKLGSLRYHMNLTQREIAELADVTPMTIRNWESGRLKPSIPNLKKLLEVYIRQHAFTPGYERIEAENLWKAVDRNRAFDEEWFIVVQKKYQEQEVQDTPSPGKDEPPSDDKQVALSLSSLIIEQPSEEAGSETIGSDRQDHPQKTSEVVASEHARSHLARQRMLDYVHSIWIKGVLEKSLHILSLINVDLRALPEVVKSPLGSPLREMYHTRNTRLLEASIVEAYENAHGKLLLLGEPGSGKTMLLLQLTRVLLERAREDEQHPIPVIFNLASWARQRQPLTKWLVEELSTKYNIPRKLGQQWLENRQLLPLLDGLDEVAYARRAGCIDAINAFLRDHGLVPTVVCSRSADYLSLSRPLLLHSAVEVQPLAYAQVDSCLAQMGKRSALLKELLTKDTELRDLATTPLMLLILVAAYEDQPVESARTTSAPTMQQQALATYVMSTLKRRSPHSRYDSRQTLHWLHWLAYQLQRHQLSDFYIELMQMDWLPDFRLRRLYPAFAVGLAYGILTSIGFGISYIPLVPFSYVVLVMVLLMLFNMLLYGLYNGVILGRLPRASKGERSAGFEHDHVAGKKGWLAALAGNRVVYGVLNGVLDGVFIGYLVNPVSGWICGLFTCAFCATLGTLDAEIHCAEHIAWSWSSMVRHVYKFLAGGLLVGLLYGLVTGRAFLFEPAKLFPSLLLGLGIGLIVGLVMSIRGGFTNKVPNTNTMLQPNQGIRNSFRYSLFFGLFFAVAFGLIFALIYGPALFLILGQEYRSSFPANSGLIYGLSDGFLIGSFFWLLSGGIAFTQHELLRFLLWRRGDIPWRFARFLDHAADLALLHKVGGGYIFLHRLLQEYFVSLDDPALEAGRDRAGK